MDFVPDTSVAAIFARVQARLDATGKSARQASLESGGSYIIPNLRKGSVPSVAVIAKLATVLNTRPGFLAYGIEHKDTDRKLPDVGAADKLLSGDQSV